MSKDWRILWVEDDHEGLDALLLPVRRHGVRVVACSSYSEALDYLVSESFTAFLIDLILPCRPYNEKSNIPHDNGSEQRLPWYWGLETIKAVRAKQPQAPIAVFSVVFDPRVDSALRELGVHVKFNKGTQSNKELCVKLLDMCQEASNE